MLCEPLRRRYGVRRGTGMPRWLWGQWLGRRVRGASSGCSARRSGAQRGDARTALTGVVSAGLDLAHRISSSVARTTDTGDGPSDVEILRLLRGDRSMPLRRRTADCGLFTSDAQLALTPAEWTHAVIAHVDTQLEAPWALARQGARLHGRFCGRTRPGAWTSSSLHKPARASISRPG